MNDKIVLTILTIQRGSTNKKGIKVDALNAPAGVIDSLFNTQGERFKHLRCPRTGHIKNYIPVGTYDGHLKEIERGKVTTLLTDYIRAKYNK